MKKKIIIICSILLLYCIGGIAFTFLKKEFKTKKDEGITMKRYNYVLFYKDMKIYKDEFMILKSNLESSNINYLDYAKSISKLFLIDLYSLNEKENVYDIGGTEFIYPSALENYKLNVANTLYKYMKDNSNGKREQELPTVSNVIVATPEETKYEIDKKEYDGYKISLDIEYEKDLGYDKKADLTLIRDKNYLYIVEKN